MVAGRRDGDGPLGRLLAFHVGIVERVVAEGVPGLVPFEAGRRDVELLGVEADRFGQRADGDDLEPLDDGPFLRVLVRHQQSALALLASGQSHRQDALGPPHRAVERQLARGRKAVEPGRG